MVVFSFWLVENYVDKVNESKLAEKCLRTPETPARSEMDQKRSRKLVYSYKKLQCIFVEQ